MSSSNTKTRAPIFFLITSSLAGAVLLLACGTTAPPKPANASEPTTGNVASKLQTTSADNADAERTLRCELLCEGARVVSDGASVSSEPRAVRPVDQPDYHASAVANADKVFNEMHGDLLACYKRRVALNPQAHAFLTVDIVVGPEGNVRNVATSGGAMLGNATMDCIVSRIKAATFEPVYGGGTRHIQVPLTLRRLGPESI